MKRLKKNNIAIIIPAYNEDKLIFQVLSRLKLVIKKHNIYVVDDGSTDATAAVVQSAGCRLLRLTKNGGKAHALNTGISYFRLPQKYAYIFPLDADTVISPTFLDEILQCFQKQKRKTAAIVGHVAGRTKNWITLYRMWEYELGQAVHKSAQNVIGGIHVCSGCSTVYRADIFKRFKIPEHTLTEDMDITFLLHRKRAGRIVYCKHAKVTTQDPDTIPDYIRQCRRWYTGFWQCISKYNLPWKGKPLDFEIALLATDGLLSCTITSMVLVLSPVLLLYTPHILIFLLSFDLLVFMLPSLLFVSFKQKSVLFFRYILHFYFLRTISSLIFLESFLRYVFALDVHMAWNKNMRYDLSSH